MQQTYPDLDTYKRQVFAREDDLLKSIMPAAVEQGIPRISVSPEAGQTLYLLAKTIGAKKFSNLVHSLAIRVSGSPAHYPKTDDSSPWKLSPNTPMSRGATTKKPDYQTKQMCAWATAQNL